MEGKTNWQKLSKPPISALKQIQAGRLKGKSDINPQWRYQAMTDVYGECGIGWKYEVVRLWTEVGPKDQIFAFAQINLYTRQDGKEWSAPIAGIGGSMLVALESSGLHANDEAFKMSVTDALGTAMKMLGVAAEIYLGNFDGSKYKNELSKDTGAELGNRFKYAPQTPPDAPKAAAEAQSREAQVPAPAPDGPQTITGVTKVVTRVGKGPHRIVGAAGIAYNTFSDTFKKLAEEAKEAGLQVRIAYKANNFNGFDIVSIENVEARQPGEDG